MKYLVSNEVILDTEEKENVTTIKSTTQTLRRGENESLLTQLRTFDRRTVEMEGEEPGSKKRKREENCGEGDRFLSDHKVYHFILLKSL